MPKFARYSTIADQMKSRLVIAVLFACLLLSACKNDDEVQNQRTAIESYMNSRGDFTESNGVYRYVINRDREDYASADEAAGGDSIIFLFQASTFASSPANTPFFSNDPDVIARLEQATNNLNPYYWDEGPLRVKIGATQLIKGLTEGLAGCRTGDSALLVMTSDLAYGDKYAGTVPKNTAIAYMVYSIEVKKQ